VRSRLCGTHDFIDICKLFVGRNCNRLDEELVSAFCIQRRFYFHGLEENCEQISTETYTISFPYDKTYQQPQPPFQARFFLSWDGRSIYIIINNSSQARRGIAYCFGAVVLTYRCASHQQPPTRRLRSTKKLTLKATGVWLVFLILRTCDTSLVNGPVHIHQPNSSHIRSSTYAGMPTPGDRFRPTC
jgi:hypothetical protein